MNDARADSLTVSCDEYDRDIAEARAEGVADERARCEKVLEALAVRYQQAGHACPRSTVLAAIAALSEAPTSPVASSPVGGEQHVS